MGTSNGMLQVWRDYGCISEEKRHEGALLTITCNNLFLLTGGSDGLICIFSVNYTLINKIDIMDITRTPFDPQVKSIATCTGSTNFAAMLRSGEIIDITCSDVKVVNNSEYKGEQIRASHFNLTKNKISRLTGLASLNQSSGFITCSEDGVVMIWNCEEPWSSQSISLDVDHLGLNIVQDGNKEKQKNQLVCMDVSPNDYFVAVGTANGQIKVIFFKTYK